MSTRKKQSKKVVSKNRLLPIKRLNDRASMDSMFDDMRKMQEKMSPLFHSFYSVDPITGSRLSLPLALPQKDEVVESWVRPLSDFYETPTQVCADVDLPGIDKKDIQLNVTKDRVEIRAEKKEESTGESKGVFRMERSYAGFFRSFILPSTVDASHVKAKFVNGVLKIRIPKTNESLPPSKRVVIE